MKSKGHRPLRLCLVSCSLAPAFRKLGHEVLALRPNPGVCDFPRLLRVKNFSPDIIIQQESLGPRILLCGLESIPCLKVFWSIDTHLNAFWQEEYARLFDLTLSTQKRWADCLRRWGPINTAWLPWFGQRLLWKPWKDRTRQMAFVGRVTEHRPSRKRFVEFLQERFGLEPIQDVSFEEMLQIYRQTRLAPNEAIFGEINFRVFEAASCGCLVFNQAGIPGLEDILTPDREIVVFTHALELAAKISRFLNNPMEAERMAKAAWARIQDSHLPVHRAQKLLALAQDIITSTAQVDNHVQARGTQSWTLALYRLWQAKRAPVNGDHLRDMLLALPESSEKRVALMGFWTGMQEKKTLAHSLSGMLQSNHYQGNALVNQVASLAALQLGDTTMAKAFWLRHRATSALGCITPGSAMEFYLAWAREWQRLGRPARPGLPFDHERHLPESALECLIMAHRLDSRNMDVCRRIDALLDKQSGFEPLRLSLLSHLTLHQRQDWLASLKLGLVNLQGFRLKQGLEEIVLAEQHAGRQSQAQKFRDALAVIDSNGLIRQTLFSRSF
ncbi:MAG TPA: hypothetical protein ENN39_06905 [Desulfonatronum sp.]|nr:hypothetical protein [Desulfonatronum sp.]